MTSAYQRIESSLLKQNQQNKDIKQRAHAYTEKISLHKKMVLVNIIEILELPKVIM